MGNHTWNTKEITGIFRKEDNVIRPANFSSERPGKGSMLLYTKKRG